MACPAGRSPNSADLMLIWEGEPTWARLYLDEAGVKSENTILLNVFTLLLFGIRLRDSQSGMWVFRRSILPLLSVTSDGMALSEELKIEAFRRRDLVSRELPIYYKARVGESKLNLWHDGLANLLFLFRKRWQVWTGSKLEAAEKGTLPRAAPVQASEDEK